MKHDCASIVGELTRLLVLTLALIWVTAPFRQGRLLGTGDSTWYLYQVTDAVEQARAGVFPLLVGQSDAAFNGAIHPHRSAPLLLHSVAALDFFTGQNLTPLQLHNLTAQLWIFLAGFSMYGALLRLRRTQRWSATLLALVYAASPSLLGLTFAQDMYMSLTATPWIPWAVVGACELGRKSWRRSAWIFGASAGALCWAHPPIALWICLPAGLLLLARAALECHSRAALSRWFRQGTQAALLFGAVAAYPVYSVLSLRAPGETLVPLVVDRANIWRALCEMFPASVLPLTREAPLLSMLQPGYAALLGALIAVAAGIWSWKKGGARAALAGVSSLGLLLLILPVPHLNPALWAAVPQALVNLTNQWPAQRIAIAAAAFGLVAWQGVFRRRWRLQATLLFIAAAWAVHEAEIIRDVAFARTYSPEQNAFVVRHENMNVCVYCYQQLPQLPRTFTHGVTAPELELRFLSADGSVAGGNRAYLESHSRAAWTPLTLKTTPTANVYRTSETWTLQPGQRYLLTFDFADAQRPAHLWIKGANLQRVYRLPYSGESRAFGSGPTCERSLPLWTTADQPEVVFIDYIPDEPLASNAPPPALGRVRLTQIEPAALPIRVENMIPLTLTISAEAVQVLETMRMFTPGWSARLNGESAPVLRSAEGLAAVQIPAGESRLELRYEGPPFIRAVFFISGFFLIAAAFALGAITLRSAKFQPKI